MGTLEIPQEKAYGRDPSSTRHFLGEGCVYLEKDCRNSAKDQLQLGNREGIRTGSCWLLALLM